MLEASNQETTPDTHYYDTHDVAGRTVTRSLAIDVSEYDPRRVPKTLIMKEVNVPVSMGKSLAVLRMLQYDVPPSTEGKEQDKPRYTMVFFGGGDAQAKAIAHYVQNIEAGLKASETNLPFQVDRIIIAPQIATAPKTATIQKPSKQAGKSAPGPLELPARMYQKALEDPEIKVSSDGMVLMGFSLGATQATELAALMKKDCKYLILAEPAGMAEHPNLAWRFSIGTLWDTVKKYHVPGNSFLRAVAEALKEFQTSWGSDSGAPSLLYIARQLIKPFARPYLDNTWSKRISQAYGFEKERQAEGLGGPFLKMSEADTTQKARKQVTAQVAYAPVLYADVVNLILDNLSDKYPSVKVLQEKFEENPLAVCQDGRQIVQDLFPHAQAAYFTPYPEQTHSSVSYDKEFWPNLFSRLSSEIEQDSGAKPPN